MKLELFNRRNFLRLGATGVAALGITKTAAAQMGKNENNLLKTSGLTQEASDHGTLAGLTDDDHPQYLTNQRADVRYPTLNADGKINPAQVGNFTSVQNGQSLQLRDGAIINVSETYRRLDTEFGVVADGVTNNAAAIQTALNAVRDSFGGTLVFPNGVTKIAGNSSINSNLKAGAIKLVGAGNSVVQITPGTNTAFAFHDNPSLTVEGLTFIGVHGAGAYDFTEAVFLTSYVEQVTFRDCQFLGLSVNAPYGEPYNGYAPNKHHGIIVANEGDLLIERCIFGGNATNQCPNVGVDTWNSLTIKDCQFLDYGYHKSDTLTKTGYTTNTWWVRATNPKPASARSRNKVSIERTTFDEGCYAGVMVYGAQWVELDNVTANMGLGATISLIAVKYAKIKDCMSGNVGLTTTQECGIYAANCNLVEVENFFTNGTVKKIILDGTTARAIFKNCQLQGSALTLNGVINNSGAIVEIIN